MKRPWQVWLAFAVCLAAVLVGMTWLTIKAVEVDTAEQASRAELEVARHQAELARKQTEIEEDVSLALWRMDTAITPLLAWESARPYFEYRSLFELPTGGKITTKGNKKTAGESQIVSPLVVPNSELVLLHFELTPDNQLTSPQVPEQAFLKTVLENGATAESVKNGKLLLAEMRKQLNYTSLVARLPSTLLPPLPVGQYASNSGSDVLVMNRINGPGFNDLGLKDLKQQLPNQPPQRDDSHFKELAAGPLPASPRGEPTSQSPSSKPADRPSEIAQPKPTSPAPITPPQTTPTPNAPAGEGIASNDPQSSAPQASDPSQSRGHQLDDLSQQGGQQQRGQQVSPLANYPQHGNSQQPAAQNKQQSLSYSRAFDPQSQLSRGGEEWNRRNRAYQAYSQQAVLDQRNSYDNYEDISIGNAKPGIPQEGISRPLWIGDQLVLARRVVLGDKVTVQGVWLDWPKLRALLMEQVADLLPNVDLTPVGDDSAVRPHRILATLPVQLVVPEFTQGTLLNIAPPLMASGELSSITISLWIAWVCLLLGALAAGVMLWGVLALSERRGAFVSAVTHELRTPLTTFRMYAEMLSEGMVTDPAQQQTYLGTLRVESDRLSHLVENVLAYARLERGRPGGRREPISLAAIFERAKNRLADRANQAGMELIVDLPEEFSETVAHTDPTAVEQILFNLVDNAGKYAALADDQRITLRGESRAGKVLLSVSDHGPGLPADVIARLFHPFSKSVEAAANSAPGVGLGLALCRRLARDLGGELQLSSNTASGATFTLSLPAA